MFSLSIAFDVSMYMFKANKYYYYYYCLSSTNDNIGFIEELTIVDSVLLGGSYFAMPIVANQLSFDLIRQLIMLAP